MSLASTSPVISPEVMMDKNLLQILAHDGRLSGKDKSLCAFGQFLGNLDKSSCAAIAQAAEWGVGPMTIYGGLMKAGYSHVPNRNIISGHLRGCCKCPSS